MLNYNQKIDEDKFCEILSMNKNLLEPLAKKCIEEYNLTYEHLTKIELEEALQVILSKALNKAKVKSGINRRLDWECGWQENLDEFRESLEEKKLKPKYYRPEKYARIDGTYVRPANDDFVYKFSRILQSQIYSKELKCVDNIYEFGCGSGHNLEFLNRIYPDKSLVGLDWSKSAVNLVNLLTERISPNITGRIFDFFKPYEHDFSIPQNSAFITMGGLEQVGKKHDKFIDFILEKKPEVVVNIEPIQEFYNTENLSELIAFNYHEQRNYLKDYYPALRELETKGLIKIKSATPVNFGGMFHDGWSIIIWSPNV